MQMGNTIERLHYSAIVEPSSPPTASCKALAIHHISLSGSHQQPGNAPESKGHVLKWHTVFSHHPSEEIANSPKIFQFESRKIPISANRLGKILTLLLPPMKTDFSILIVLVLQYSIKSEMLKK